MIFVLNDIQTLPRQGFFMVDRYCPFVYNMGYAERTTPPPAAIQGSPKIGHKT